MSARGAVVRSRADKRTGRRVWHTLRILLIVVLAAEVCLAVRYSPALRVKEVHVEGIALTSPQQIVQTANIPTSWVALGPSQIARRLQQLPTVDEALVSRGMPGEVRIRVFERRPVALLCTDNGSYWVDARGVPFRATKQADGLYVISVEGPLRVVLGQAMRNESVQAALEILLVHLPKYPLPVAQITVDREGNLCLNMRDGLPGVRMGNSAALPQKLQCAVQMWIRPEIARRAEYFDVSCVEKPVWKPRQEGKGAL